MAPKLCPRCGRFVPGWNDQKYCDKCIEVEGLKAENEALKTRLALIEPSGLDQTPVTLRIEEQDLPGSLADSVPKLKALLALGVDCIRIMKED